MLTVISLGAGVQSTTMALMAARRELTPMPDAAIFADTGWEPNAVYNHLAWLVTQLPFPVHVVEDGNIRDEIVDGAAGKRWASIPAFVRNAGGKREGMIRRQCTQEYKLRPIRRKVRELAGLVRKRSPDHAVCEQWIGISTDEALRMKPSKEPWQINRWPLIERSMSRNDCLVWLADRNYPRPPKSACIGCPYHTDAQWLDIKADPAAWADAVEIDRTIRTGFRGMTGQLFLHRTLVPLDQVEFKPDESAPDLFNNECEGMCGV